MSEREPELPGLQLVLDLLGQPPEDLLRDQHANSPRHHLVTQIAREAERLDELAHRLRTRALWAAGELLRISERRTPATEHRGGILQGTAHTIDILASQLYDSHKHLGVLCQLYLDTQVPDLPGRARSPSRIPAPAASDVRGPKPSSGGRRR